MRLLVVSNFYPPHHLGGYEIGCSDVVDGLRERGHDVQVLTSTYGVIGPQVDGHVHRVLEQDLSADLRRGSRRGGWAEKIRAAKKESHNRRVFRHWLRTATPDVVYFWNLLYSSPSLGPLARGAGVPICHFFFDYFYAEWSALEDPWYAPWARENRSVLARIAKPLLRVAARAAGLPTTPGEEFYPHVHCGSEHIAAVARRSGKRLGTVEVVPWGIDPARFPCREFTSDPPRRLLFVGQVHSHKGIHVAIEALGHLRAAQPGLPPVTLNIVGGSTQPDYVDRLQTLVREHQLERSVRFQPAVPREALPALYREHDIFLFPSVWDEPFGIVVLEAMASGLVVVGTATGGSGETMIDGENCLVYPREDARACADRLACLLREPERYDQLRRQARRYIETERSFDRTVAGIERSLQHIAAGCRSAQREPRPPNGAACSGTRQGGAPAAPQPTTP
ncbi:glycosyltransferase family 4 protein [bacterium]|nr:glycosyltransferase family 4 protein [bacterium]